MSSKDKAIVEHIDNAFAAYTGSSVYSNWKMLCDNINDAAEQRYRPGEQLTRQGMYYGIMRAQRDGWRESFIDSFGQAKPLFTYSPRRGIDAKLASRAQEEISDIWQDIDGLTNWLAICNDAIDYAMGIAYTKYCHYSGEIETPTVTKQLWGDMLEWQDEFRVIADSPDFIRVHPYNYRCSLRGGSQPEWEGVEWEWTVADLYAMLGDDTWNQSAIKRLIEKVTKGEIGRDSQTFYSQTKTMAGHASIQDKCVYAREYWGPLHNVEGMQKDHSQYVVVTCEGEVLRKQVNKLGIGRKSWRPIKRVRLDPMNDLPYGAHVMAATLSHQRMKNLMNNLAADDIVIRQHLGLAVWRGSLENPNQLLNPEGAREPLYMRHDHGKDKLPIFFADQSSGVLRDVMAFDSQVIERDQQISGLPYQAMGMGGGAQGKTATEQTYLANNTSRKLRTSIINSIETGLEPICKDLLGLLLRNKPPEDMGFAPRELAEIFANNFWEFDTTLTSNLPAQSSALAQWGSMAMQQMSAITPAGQPGSADHIVRLLKDTGKAMGLSTVAMDAYLPEGMAPQIPGPAAVPTAPMLPEAQPMPPPEMAAMPEEAMNAMA